MSEAGGFREEKVREKIMLRMDETKLISSDQEGETGGLGPCLGLVILDKPGKRAFLGHLSNPDHFIDDELDGYLKGLSDVPQLRVFLGGMENSDYPDEQNNAIRDLQIEARGIVIDAFRKRGFTDDHIRAEWIEGDDDLSADIRVVPADGLIEYDLINMRTHNKKRITLGADLQNAD